MTEEHNFRCGVTDSGLTRCLACSNKEMQKQCKFYSKASHEKRCMFLKFEEYCDWCEGMGK